MKRRALFSSGLPAFRGGLILLAAWLAVSGLAACELAIPGQPKVVVVTATPTQPSAGAQPQVVMVTATFTPAPPPTAVPTEPPPATLTPEPTADLVATQVAALQAAAATLTAQAPPPTDTPEPTPTATETPVPPTGTPKPVATRKPTATAVVAYPPPILMGPDPGFNCYQLQGCYFTWSWAGTLKANEYFQVQLVGPANGHRGIHPPTKDYSFQSNWTVYQIVTDWCDPSKYCNIKWTVAIIEWDGKDPSKIGRTIIEATPRDVKL